RAEQIRIEVARGKRSARVEVGGRMHALTAGGAGLTLDGKPVASAQFAGPLRLDGRELPGRLEVFSERGALVAVNSVDLEQYVAAVVASEIPPGWPAEALRAQAVAARTFAVAQKIAQGPGARAHLGASVLDQVYRNAARTPQPALDAARATAGEVLTWGAAPIAAYFSASCGGRSESAEAAFHLAPGTAPYLRGGQRRWRRRVSGTGERSRRRTLPVGGTGQSACGSDVSGHSRAVLPRRRAPPHVLNAELLPYLAVDEDEPRERKRVQEGADEGGGDGAPGAGRKQAGGSGSEDRERDDQDPHPQRLPPVSCEQPPRPFQRGTATQALDDDERRCEGEAGGEDEPGDDEEDRAERDQHRRQQAGQEH